MKTHAGIFLVMLCVSGFLSPTVTPNESQKYMTEAKMRLHLLAQGKLLNDRFAEVDSIYAEFIKEYPTDPAGYLFRSAALIAEMSDREEDIHGDRAKLFLDSTVSLATRLLDSSDNRSTRAWMHLWLGHAKANRSLYLSQFGSFISALKQGMASKGDYHKALKEDSTLYDAYFGLGSYHYWKSAKAGILGWLRIFKNEKKKGIRELHLAEDSSLLSRDIAVAGLTWVWLDKKEYDSTIVYASKMTKAYPEGKSFFWPLAEAYFRKKDYASAIEVYRQLREPLERNPGNYYNLIEVDYQICRTLEKWSRPDELPAIAKRTEGYLKYISKVTWERQEGKINYLRGFASKGSAD